MVEKRGWGLLIYSEGSNEIHKQEEQYINDWLNYKN